MQSVSSSHSREAMLAELRASSPTHRMGNNKIERFIHRMGIRMRMLRGRISGGSQDNAIPIIPHAEAIKLSQSRLFMGTACDALCLFNR